MAINRTERAKRVTHTYRYTVEGEADIPTGHARKQLLRPAGMRVDVINGTSAGAVVTGPRVLKAGLSDSGDLRHAFGDYNADSAPQWVRDAISACVADAAADQ